MTRRIRSAPFLLIMALILVIAAGSTRPAGAQNAGTFLWISDIHLDIFYYAHDQDHPNLRDRRLVQRMLKQMVDNSDPNNPKWKDHTAWGPILAGSPPQGSDFNQRGFDSNDKLLQAVVAKAGKTSPQPDFILITGDHLGHQFGSNYSELAPASMQTGSHYNTFVAQTLDYIAMSIRRGFAANIPIYATLGNNDAYCGDYDIRLDQPSSEFLENTADTFLRYFLSGLSPPEQQTFRTTFLQGGFYSVTLPKNSATQLVVLNSIPFMGPLDYPEPGNAYPGTSETCTAGATLDPGAQLDWFEKLVAGAGTGHAWVAAHVPPGVGCYHSHDYWSAPSLKAYRGVFNSGSALELAGTLSAHSHMASFKLLLDANNDPASFVLQGPSVSPNHDNNPSFRVVTYGTDNLQIGDYRTHYLDLDTKHWSSFSFQESYGLPVTTKSLAGIFGDMQTDAATWNQFVHNYGTRAEKYVSLGYLSQTNLGCIGSLTGN